MSTAPQPNCRGKRSQLFLSLLDRRIYLFVQATRLPCLLRRALCQGLAATSRSVSLAYREGQRLDFYRQCPVGVLTNVTVQNTGGLAAGIYNFCSDRHERDDYSHDKLSTDGTARRWHNYAGFSGRCGDWSPLKSDAGVGGEIKMRLLIPLKFSTNQSFTAGILSQNDNQQLFCDHPRPCRALTTYYWRVKTTTPCGDTPWSAARSF